MDVLWNNRLCLFHLVFMGHPRDLKASEPPEKLLQGSAVPTAGALVSPRPGRCSCLRNLVPLPFSYDSLLIQKYFPAVPGKPSLYLPLFKGSNAGVAESICRRGACSPRRKPWVCSVICSPPATSASVARLMLSTSRNVNARTVRWPLLTAAGYKLVLLNRKVLYPVLSIRTVCASIQAVPVQELSQHTLETKP